ncbi:MAG: hypothetical protein EOP11_06885 [Proteobacteria bacterium]|nr:MAG: hypothetical protein EOP11_06885 [Pseudomonadota bacterium]
MKVSALTLTVSLFALTACGGDYNVNCSAYVGPNLPADYVTGTCNGDRFNGTQPSTGINATGVCTDGGYVSGRLDNGTPFSGTCSES